MRISSSAFLDNEEIPSKYTCEGENINPPLHFHDVSKSAESLVLIVEDPDAPSKVWKHWLIYNLDPQLEGIDENSVPESGKEGMTDFGKPGYGGPCPPSGTHRYFFRLYALDKQLQIEGDPTVDIIREYMQEHILEEAELVGLYRKKT